MRNLLKLLAKILLYNYRGDPAYLLSKEQDY